MSRRSGQDSQPFKAGKWWRVRVRFDMPGVEERQQKSLKVCPVALRLSKPEIKRMAADVIAVSGANSKERFDRVVLGEGVTFREQSKLYLQEATTRNRRPIKDPSSIQSAFDKWILPAIGDLMLSMVDNLSLKPLVRRMVEGGLSPRAVNKYVEYVKQVVKSRLAPNGEPLYRRTWNPEVLDLPVVEYRKQKRPSLKVDGINALVVEAKPGQMRVLFVLLAATGLRISEALALEARHFINNYCSIVVEQQVDRNCPRIVPYVKTDASFRQIDLHFDVANYLRPYISHKKGLIFHTRNHTPHLYGNLAEDWLDPLLNKLNLAEDRLGWHGFRRYRNTWLRGQRCQEDLLKFWMGHKPHTMTENYSMLREDQAARWEEVKKAGYGFSLPANNVPSVPRISMPESSRKSPANCILANRMTSRGARSSVG